MASDCVFVDGVRYSTENAEKLEELVSKRVDSKIWKPIDTRACNLVRPAERRIKDGLAFFTKRSKYSSFYDVEIEADGTPYKTLEHACQGKSALIAKDQELHKTN